MSTHNGMNTCEFILNELNKAGADKANAHVN